MVENYAAEMAKLYAEIIKAKSDDKTTTLPVICPGTFLHPCRLCDLAKTILFKRDNKDTPIRKQAGDLNRKKSYYSNTIFPTNPSEIVVFQYGETIWKELMLFQMSPTSEIQDFLDPKKGRNIVITKTIGSDKRQTKYSVKSRINPSPLLDLAVLRKLSEEPYQLHNILELIKLGKIKPFYQSMLQEGENELRFLPSWLGPGVTKFFQHVLYHYGVTEEEFQLIQKGDYNPFAGELTGVTESGEVKKVFAAPAPAYHTDVPIEKIGKLEPKSPWDEYTAPKAEQVVVPKKEEAYPPCFGKKHDVNDPECVEDCAKDGWEPACKTATEALQRASLEQRKVAKRLIK